MFNADALRGDDPLSIVEGAFDVIGLERLGHRAFALSGLQLPDDALPAFRREGQEVRVALDRDAAEKAVDLAAKVGPWSGQMQVLRLCVVNRATGEIDHLTAIRVRDDDTDSKVGVYAAALLVSPKEPNGFRVLVRDLGIRDRKDGHEREDAEELTQRIRDLASKHLNAADCLEAAADMLGELGEQGSHHARGRRTPCEDPQDRRLWYETALETGYRVSELRALKVGNLDPFMPSLTLEADHTKNRKEARQPITRELAEKLSARCEGKPQDFPLLNIPRREAWRPFNTDCEKAGIRQIAVMVEDRLLPDPVESRHGLTPVPPAPVLLPRHTKEIRQARVPGGRRQ